MKYEKLIVVESPTKVKSIESYLKSLGYKNCIVLASYGHISNLLGKQSAIDVNRNFKMTWQNTKQSEKALPKIIQAAKESQELIIGTDPDREGEAIGWHIIRALKEKKINLPVKRLLFYSITKDAIKKSMESLTDMRENLISAYLARLGLDFLVGFYVSPLLWRKLPGCLSAGRVQSAALRNIVELEYERVQFKPRQYYVINALFQTSSQEELKGKLYEAENEKFERGCLYEISEEKLARIQENIQKDEYRILNVETKEKSKSPPAPYITSTLQQDASTKLHFSPASTMKLAQQLYEGVKLDSKETTGLITYMRTDNVHMAQDAITACRSWVKNNLGEEYVHKTVRMHKSKVKNAQEAHECIRPTNFELTPERAKMYLDDNAAKVYELIWKRAVASQMSSAIYKETTADISNDLVIFKTSGNIKIFDGYTHFHKQKEAEILPNLENNQKVTLGEVETDSKETTPPSRYTAASLIARMETLGIGRPSTFTRIVDTLLEREYITKQEGYLVPTQRSWFLIAFLKEFFAKYVEYEFTAQLEDQLDEISNGALEWHKVLQSFWNDFHKKVDSVKDIKYDDMKDNIQTMWHDLFFQDAPEVCQKCGAKAQVRFWHGKAFISCSTYPQCDWITSLQGSGTEPLLVGIDPETQQNIRMLEGQYGPYFEWEATAELKAKRVSIPPMLKGKELGLEEAMKLKQMPLAIGEYKDLELKVGFGRFGPYILYDSVFYPLKGNPMEIKLEEAIQILEAGIVRKAKRATKTATKTTSKTAVKRTTKAKTANK